MCKRAMLGMLATVFVMSPAVVRAGDLKTADEVITKYIEALGGRKALDAIKTIRMTGKNVMTGGMEMPITVEFKKPSSVRIDITFQGMNMIQAYDGKIGWRIMPFAGNLDPQKMSEDEAAIFESQADLEPFVDYAKKGHKVKLLGKKDADGSEAYEIALTRKDGTVEHHFFDAEFFLPIKVTGTQKMQGMEMEYDKSLGDYKKVSGVMIAHSITNQAKGNPMAGSTLTFEKTEVNIDIPDSRFAMPKVKSSAPEAKPAESGAAKKPPAAKP